MMKDDNPKSTDGVQLNFLDRFQFDPRFLERLAGKKLLHDPRVAVVELVANAWDAGATKVSLTWPTQASPQFEISDNGEGMTEQDFLKRWQWMAYDRVKHQGRTVKLPDNPEHPQRRVYGRNGIGRFAAFCFGDDYEITTKCDGHQVRYRVWRSINDIQPFDKQRKELGNAEGHGTTIRVPTCKTLILDEKDIQGELAMRFLADPMFHIVVNGQNVDLRSIPEKHIAIKKLHIDGLFDIEVVVIDVSQTDRTMQHHGIAFHVNNRLVGDITWRQPGFSEPVDGRSVGGKRLLFIVKVDPLQDRDAVKKDWTGFEEENEDYKRVITALEKYIQEHLETLNEEDQEDLLKQAKAASMPALQRMELAGVKTWSDFVKKAHAECRSVKRADLVNLAKLLANLEATRSKYALIERLSELRAGQLEDLHGLLKEWSVDTAKMVLDEIRTRMRLLTELQRKVADTSTDEVQELQPVFEKGLWIFGPEYETIHYTSNRQMETVIRDLFGRRDIPGSRNRPDFVIVPEGSVGFYTYPKFGRLTEGDSGELGIAKLVVVELKRPGVCIGNEQKNQAWKYISELIERGLVTMDIPVDAFVIGSKIKPSATMVRTEGRCKIMPMLFGDVLSRARSRLLNLYDQVKEAPFIKEALAEFDAIDKMVKESAPLFMAQQD